MEVYKDIVVPLVAAAMGVGFSLFVAAKTEQATNRFNAIDADADGGITKTELYNALKQQQERKAIRRECVEEQREVDELLEG